MFAEIATAIVMISYADTLNVSSSRRECRSTTEEILAIRKDVFPEGKPEERDGLATPKQGRIDEEEEV